LGLHEERKESEVRRTQGFSGKVAAVMLAMFLLGSVFAPEPAEAQIPVTDVLHVAETIAQYVQDLYHYLEMWKSAYEKIQNPVWRDFYVRELLERTLEAAETGDVSYVLGEAGQVLKDAFPGPFVFASLEGEEGDLLTAGKLNADWSKWARDAMAGALQSASVHADDYGTVMNDLEELKGRADGAEGLSQTMHVANQLRAAMAMEQVKTHQLMASLIQVESVGRAHEISERAAAEATARAFLSGELNEDEPEEPPVESHWPF